MGLTWEVASLLLVFYMHFEHIQNNLINQNDSLQNYKLYAMGQKWEINLR